MLPFTNIRLTSRFNFIFFTFSVTIQTTRASQTPNTGANCPVLHFTAAVTEIPGTAVTTGQGSLSEGRGHIQCRACLRKANKRQWALHIHVFPPYRVYGNPARSCNSFDLRYSNPSAKRDNWVIMSKGDVTFSPVIFASKKWMKNLWCTPS